jgi:hypothetical protein
MRGNAYRGPVGTTHQDGNLQQVENGVCRVASHYFSHLGYEYEDLFKIILRFSKISNGLGGVNKKAL